MALSQYYKIIYNTPTGQSVSFFTTNYEILDDGATISFLNYLKGETKRLPYVLCEIKVLTLAELPEWVIKMFAEASYEV